MSTIKKMVNNSSLEKRTIFTGMVKDRNELVKLYNCADLNAMLSLYDSSSLSIGDAACFSVPSLVISSSNAVDSCKLMDNENSFLC
jgi:glycosyltransferase involved in cell wall biosynthesis